MSLRDDTFNVPKMKKNVRNTKLTEKIKINFRSADRVLCGIKNNKQYGNDRFFKLTSVETRFRVVANGSPRASHFQVECFIVSSLFHLADKENKKYQITRFLSVVFDDVQKKSHDL